MEDFRLLDDEPESQPELLTPLEQITGQKLCDGWGELPQATGTDWKPLVDTSHAWRKLEEQILRTLEQSGH